MTRALTLLLMLMASQASAETIGLQNGSFETGDLTGWTVHIDQGVSNVRGKIAVIDAVTVAVDDGARFGVLPLDEQYLLTLGTQEGGFFFSALSYESTVFQTVQLDAGSAFSGFAKFRDGDMEIQDSAFVRILDSTGVLVATPWFRQSGCDCALPLNDWTHWTWTAPESGAYTLVLGAGTFGDDNLASRAFFDGITIATPEPASGLLLLGAGIGLWRQQIQQRRKRAAA